MLTLALMLSGFTYASHAQTFPTKPVRFIVTFPPGGGLDLVARLIGQTLTERWQPIADLEAAVRDNPADA
ncbi:MAG: tripartite tricarboxylate transporter substrate binding protein, partial [Burkholderiales bacterium]